MRQYIDPDGRWEISGRGKHLRHKARHTMQYNYCEWCGTPGPKTVREKSHGKMVVTVNCATCGHTQTIVEGHDARPE